MVELISLGCLILISIIGGFDNYQLFNISHNSILIFMLYARLFVTVASDRSVKEKTRIFIESVLYLICTSYFIFAFNFFKCPINQQLLQIFSYCLALVCIATSKIYLFKTNIYGNMYVFWQIVDCVLILSLGAVDFIITEPVLKSHKGIQVMSFVILGLLAFVNEHILYSREYWVHRNAFIKTINRLIREDLIETIIIPPTRNLETDELYNKCIYILKNSTVRVIEVYRLSRLVKNLLLKAGIDRKTSALVGSYFQANLAINLMRRNLDYALLPTRVLNKMQDLKRHFKR